MRCLLSLLLTLSTVASAKEEKLSSRDLEKIQATLKSFDHLALRYSQVIFTSLRQKTRRYHGRAFFAKPNKFHWIKDDPREEIIFDGSDVFLVYPDRKLAKKFKASGSQAAQIKSLTNIVLKLDKLFTEYEVLEGRRNRKRGFVKVHLKPKQKGELEKIELSISLKENFVEQLKLIYSGRKKIFTYDFYDPKTAPIPESKFAYVPPKGVKLEVYD